MSHPWVLTRDKWVSKNQEHSHAIEQLRLAQGSKVEPSTLLKLNIYFARNSDTTAASRTIYLSASNI